MQNLETLISERTALVSIMYANNEIGTMMNIRELAAVAHRHGALFHTDAVQAYGHHRIQCREMGIDLLSASGHKFHGPKGIGFLYVRDGIDIEPLIYGGSQERGARAGTENVIGIMGMAKAAEESHDAMHLVDYLGGSDICISTGSACNMKSVFASHVLRAIHMSEEDARSTIRISLSKYSTEEEARRFVDELEKAVKLLKEIY